MGKQSGQSALVRSVIGIGCVEKLRVKQVHDGRVIEAMVRGWLSSEIAGSPCVYGWDDSDASAADARDRADVLEALAEVGGEHPSPDMEVRYANYIRSDDRMLERDGTVFYRIIERTTLPDCRSSGRLTVFPGYLGPESLARVHLKYFLYCVQGHGPA